MAKETFTVRFWKQKEDGYWEQKEEHVVAKNHDKAANEILRKHKIPREKIIRVSMH